MLLFSRIACPRRGRGRIYGSPPPSYGRDGALSPLSPMSPMSPARSQSMPRAHGMDAVPGTVPPPGVIPTSSSWLARRMAPRPHETSLYTANVSVDWYT